MNNPAFACVRSDAAWPLSANDTNSSPFGKPSARAPMVPTWRMTNGECRRQTLHDAPMLWLAIARRS